MQGWRAGRLVGVGWRGFARRDVPPGQWRHASGGRRGGIYLRRPHARRRAAHQPGRRTCRIRGGLSRGRCAPAPRGELNSARVPAGTAPRRPRGRGSASSYLSNGARHRYNRRRPVGAF